MTRSPQAVRRVSTSTVKPSPPHDRRRCDLSHWDIAMANVHYIQKGLLFTNPNNSINIDHIIYTLKTSLSVALRRFYPLSGRLVTEKSHDEKGKITGMSIHIDSNAQGAEFIHAVAENVAVADVLSPDVPAFVRSFFPLDGYVSYDGHLEPLLSVQLTELTDGVFLAFCFNHVVGDGTSYWSFLNSWAEIARSRCSSGDGPLSRNPIHDRWFLDDVAPPIKLPFRHSDEFVSRPKPSNHREKMIHLTSEAVARLKGRANQELRTTSTGSPISSFQSVATLVWRCITRARKLPHGQLTKCKLAVDNRARLRPCLSASYFGNCINAVAAEATAGELLSSGLGWSASLIHVAVAGHTEGAIRRAAEGWMERPEVYTCDMFDESCVMLGGSPRFDAYGCDFGWGKAVAARSGGANKFDGKVSFYPGREGGGSMDLEVCLLPEFMERFEADEELRSVINWG